MAIQNANPPARGRPANQAAQLTPKKPVPTRQRPAGSCLGVAATKSAQARKRLADRKAGKGGLPGGSAIVRDIMFGHFPVAAILAVMMQSFSNSLRSIGVSLLGVLKGQDSTAAAPAPVIADQPHGDLMSRRAPIASYRPEPRDKRLKRRVTHGDSGEAGGDGVSAEAAAKQAMAQATAGANAPKPGRGTSSQAAEAEAPRPKRYPADEAENAAAAHAGQAYGDRKAFVSLAMILNAGRVGYSADSDDIARIEKIDAVLAKSGQGGHLADWLQNTTAASQPFKSMRESFQRGAAQSRYEFGGRATEQHVAMNMLSSMVEASNAWHRTEYPERYEEGFRPAGPTPEADAKARSAKVADEAAEAYIPPTPFGGMQ